MNLLGAAVFAASILSLSSNAQTQQIDTSTGLITADGWQMVVQTCTRCHSARIISQNSGNREVWQSRINWMQKNQGLEQLNPDILSPILDYLVLNYGQKASSRRPELPAHLLPVNPYLTSN